MEAGLGAASTNESEFRSMGGVMVAEGESHEGYVYFVRCPLNGFIKIG